jgi:maltose alpha-D-glucosyltransferase/alpha-amylase
MVTNDERDYMYLAYSADPRMRVNLGIRRRLAPLVDNNRRRIELLNSLLLSFPGTPILYYGDEIGMGDNIYLGDRNGVRTPMQWNGDRNAGFSTATPARLYSPVIMDPVWGYEAINVEAQQGDPSSLLNWMRNMIALRKLFGVFGRGSMKLFDPSNRKVLAYLRQYQDQRVLCVANLSRFAQPVDLDLSEAEGTVPVEMLGYVDFPVIERQPYRLTLAPYGFLWLELQQRAQPTEVSTDLIEQVALNATSGWKSIFDGASCEDLETGSFPEYLPKQRWFAGKSRHINSTRILDWTIFNSSHSALVLVEVQFDTGPSEVYLVPLAMTFADAAHELQRAFPNAIVAPVISGQGSGLLHDGLFDDSTCRELLSFIAKEDESGTRGGRIHGVRGKPFHDILGTATNPLAVRRSSAEQSNTSIIYGDRLILKVLRRQEPGLNPDAEIGRYLTENAKFDRVPPFAGSIEYEPRSDGEPSTLAMLQGLVANEGDGWKWTLEELDRYFETCAPLPFPNDLRAELRNPAELLERPAFQLARDHVGIYLDSAITLGRRTAELHLALASAADDPAFAPEELSVGDLQALLAGLRQHASRVFDVLKERVPYLPDEVVEIAAAVLSRRTRILDHFETLGPEAFRIWRIRVHGDYHLGQVLRVKTDFVILDFEGEPARPLAERRTKQCPLKDVAGMLRSFSYAAYSSLINYTTRHPEDIASLEPWAQLWERCVATEFLRAYREAAQGAKFLAVDPGEFRKVLDVFLVDKAMYEVLYELNARPAWVRIPLMGIMSLQL